MRVAGDDDLDVSSFGGHTGDVGQVQPVVLRVDFQCAAFLASDPEDFSQIELTGLAMPEQTASRMANHVDVRISNSLDESASHLARIMLELVMDRCDDPVELAQHIIGQVQTPIIQDIDFTAVKQSNPGQFFLIRSISRRWSRKRSGSRPCAIVTRRE
jgi:hypothetical protein